MQENLKTRRILTYDDLVKATPGSSQEPLVSVRKYSPSIMAVYKKPDMLQYTGDTILVRDAVAKKLAIANVDLRKIGLRLKVVYGYRHPKIQAKYFYTQKSKLEEENPELNDTSLDRLTHDFVAVPGVAGHPMGGAVDLTLVDSSDAELDMGTEIADFTDAEKIKTYSPLATKIQANSRMILHDVMVAQGFAPFYGEWWHFSYGDREWAAFYDEKGIYGAIEL